ncbi:hypothetical protein EMIT079MI2_20181 [Bacillus sp. IT-79MI2]
MEVISFIIYPKFIHDLYTYLRSDMCPYKPLLLFFIKKAAIFYLGCFLSSF